MSTAVTLARLLQETVKPSLVAAFGEAAVRLMNEDKTTTPLPLPGLVVSARDIDDEYTVKAGGRYGRNAELRVACRVDGNKADSAIAVENLAADAEAAISPVPEDWLFFQPFRQDDERTWENTTRVVTLVWKVIVLPVAV